MKIDVFTDRLRQEIEKRLGAEIRTEAAEVSMNNGVIRPGMQITKNPDVTLTVCTDTLLEAYISGMPFNEIVRRLIEDSKGIMKESEHVDVGANRSFEAVKDRICYRLVNRDMNRELLKEIPYVSFLDLAFCFYYGYCGDRIDGSIRINNSQMKQWGISTTELFGLAECNTQRLFPWECRSIIRVLEGGQQANATAGEGLPSDPDWFKQPFPMGILRNRQNLYGAACIHYPEVIARLAQEAGDDLYILPSSVHETLLLPKTGSISAQDLKEVICDTNREKVLPEEVLSGSLYYYSRSDQKVRII